MINLAHAVLHDVTSFTLLLLEVWFGDQNAVQLRARGSTAAADRRGAARAQAVTG